MKDKVFAAIGAAVLSAVGFAGIIGLWWLVERLVVGVIPQLIHSRLESAYGALVLLMILVAFVGGMLAALSPSEQEPKRVHGPFLHLRPRH